MATYGISKRPSILTLCFCIALVALCLAAGAAAAYLPPTYPLALVGLCAATAIGIWNQGALAGLLILLILNGLPFFNVPVSNVAGASIVNDAAFLSLVVLLGMCALLGTRTREQRRLARYASLYGIAYLGWWFLKGRLWKPRHTTDRGSRVWTRIHVLCNSSSAIDPGSQQPSAPHGLCRGPYNRCGLIYRGAARYATGVSGRMANPHLAVS